MVVRPVKQNVGGFTELTSFPRNLLYVTAEGDRPSRQPIKADIEQVYNEMNNGYLNLNLDTVAEKEYVDKGQIDHCTNFYDVTEPGFQAMRDLWRWENYFVDLG